MASRERGLLEEVDGSRATQHNRGHQIAEGEVNPTMGATLAEAKADLRAIEKELGAR